MTRRLLFCIGVICLLGAAAKAGDECIRECGSDLGCQAEVTDCLIDAGRVKEAIGQLKPLAREQVQTPGFAHLLCRA
jgi:hypothetical protein